jgi:hypothetical protein
LILLISTSWVGRITGVSHCTQQWGVIWQGQSFTRWRALVIHWTLSCESAVGICSHHSKVENLWVESS